MLAASLHDEVRLLISVDNLLRRYGLELVGDDHDVLVVYLKISSGLSVGARSDFCLKEPLHGWLERWEHQLLAT